MFLPFRLIHISIIIILTIAIIVSTPPLLHHIPYPLPLCSRLCYLQVLRWWKIMMVRRYAYSLIGSLNLSGDFVLHIYIYFVKWKGKGKCAENLTLGLTVASFCH
jgi:hypothetical protein